MSTVLIACPFCGFSRELAREKIPAHARRITCPECRQQFELTLEASVPPPFVVAAAEDHGVVHARGSDQWQYWQNLNGARAAAEEASATDVAELTLGGLFRQGWALYRRRMIGLTLLMIAGLILTLLPWLLPLVVALPAWPPWAWPVMLGVSLLGSAYLSTAMLVHLSSEVPVPDALRGAGSHLAGILWTAVLFGYMVLGGLTLLLLPGLFFLACFAFAFFVCVVEHERGFNALLISWQYVQGRFFTTAVKLFTIGLATLLLSLVPLLGVLMAQPFALACLCVLYHDLRVHKGFQRQIPTGLQKLGWFACGSLGFLLLVPLIMLQLNLFDTQSLLPETSRARFRRAAAVVGGDAGLSRAGGGLMLTSNQFRSGELMQVKVYSGGLSTRLSLCTARPGESCSGTIPVDISPDGSGRVDLQAPGPAGLYELRLYSDDQLGRMISSLEFKVLN